VIVNGAADRDGVVIDVNPRLVEPANAKRSGTDLVAALLEVSLGRHPETAPVGREGVATHQLLLAVLGAAALSRRSVVAELLGAARRTGVYTGSVEELTPVSGDWRAAVPVMAAVAAGLVGHAPARALASGTVTNYALSADGWRALLEEHAVRSGASPG
jgi:hypothetical protein